MQAWPPRISMSSSYTSSGRERLELARNVRGSGGTSVEMSGSSLRCEARSHPSPTGLFGSSAAWNSASFPSGSKTFEDEKQVKRRRVRN